ncbi:MAG: PHB depolymerase family esterase [Anaerolineaceae bacterium]
MRRVLRVALAVIGITAVAVPTLAYWALRHSYPPMPVLGGQLERGTMPHSGRTRSWFAYVPAKRRPAPALVMVLHSSMGSAQQAREMYGYDFDVLADQHGFVVAYPNGYLGHWNEAKIKGPFAAKQENVDDVGFLHALVDDLVKRYGVDRSRVYVTGVSNGGSMVLRLAIETPDFARAYAAVVASVPTPANMAAQPKHKGVSILFMNGTEDPMNPWSGGDVVLHGVWGNRGPVLSAQASIDYFRVLAGLEGPSEVTAFPDRDSSDGSTVERSLWTSPGQPRVVLYAIKGGGHDVPHPATYGRRLLGQSNRDIHAACEIWAFFVSASSRHQ